MPQKGHKRGMPLFHAIPLVLIAASLLTVSVSTRTLFSVPGIVFSSVSSAAQHAFSVVSGAVRNTVLSIGALKDLRNQYESLAAKMESYSTMERDYADMRSENARLKEQLGYAASLPSILVSARIIAKDPGNLYSNFIIDKGKAKGIDKNQPIVAFQNGMQGMAGKVLEARGSSCVVLPLYDQRFFVAARFSRTRTQGLVNGQGNPGEPLVMRYVSKLDASEIQIGDLVVSSGLDSIFPPDIAIGRVSAISMPEYGSSAIIYLEPSLSFSKLEYLFVLKKLEAEAPGAQAADVGGGGAGK